MKEKLQSMEEYPFQVLHTTGLYMFKMKHYHYHTCLADAVAKCESILFGEKGSTLEAIDRQTGEILWRHPKEHPKHQVWINQ